MCGIAAFYGSNAPLYTYKLLLELQHRGQESAGMSVVRGSDLTTLVRPGYVLSAISPEEVSEIDSQAAIGHVRYSTTGGYMSNAGAQPITVGDGRYRVSVAFNGNIINYNELSVEYLGRKVLSDSEVLAELIWMFYKDLGDVVDAVKYVASVVRGSFSLAVLTPEPRVVIARDVYGFKPLAYSHNDGIFIAASETAAIESAGFDLWSEVMPGNAVSYDGKSVEVLRITSDVGKFTPCVFEYIYFSRPDTVFNGVQVHEARVRMGMYVGGMDSVNADVVIPIPDSGRSAALGYSMATGIGLDEGLMRNRYVGRGFIMPPKLREFISEVKYGVIKSTVCGKRVVVVDDSLIRGTTIMRVIEVLRRKGAREVHVRIASPPIKYPCFMGIDFPTRRELIASRVESVNTIAKLINADSLLYNTVEGLKWATKLPSMCLACFTGRYPIDGVSLEYLENVFSRAGGG